MVGKSLVNGFIPTIVDQNAKNFVGMEDTAVPQFKIKITAIPNEKLANTAIRQTLMSPSIINDEDIIVSQLFQRKDYSGLTLAAHWGHRIKPRTALRTSAFRP